MSEPKPVSGSIVIYNHPASKDPKVPLHKSPAIIQSVSDNDELDLCVFAKTGILFRKADQQGDKEGQWSWPDVVIST